MHGKAWLAALLTALLSSGGTFGAAPVRYLTASQYDPARLLPPPPGDNSSAARFELAELKEIEGVRSAAQLSRAKSDDKTENASIFAEIVGPGFDLKALPATARMFADIRREEQAAAVAAKNFFKRNRPWIIDPSMASCSKDDSPQSSYPSGHATMGYSMVSFSLRSLRRKRRPYWPGPANMPRIDWFAACISVATSRPGRRLVRPLRSN